MRCYVSNKERKIKEMVRELDKILVRNGIITMDDMELVRKETRVCKKEEIINIVKKFYVVTSNNQILMKRNFVRVNKRIPIKANNVNLGKNRKAHYNKNNEVPTWMKQCPTKDDLNFCCYRFIDSNNKIIYVGRAKNLVNRLETHEHLPEECYEQIVKVEYCKFDANDDLDLAEPYFIAKWKPQYNQDFVNKNYSFQIKELENIGWREFKGGIEIISKKH